MQFVEEPRILDGDHGLGGEVLRQLDLPVGKQQNFLAVDGDYADQLACLEDRQPEQCPDAAEFNPGNRQRIVFKIAFICTIVGNVEALASFSDTIERAERTGPMRPPLEVLCERRRYAQAREDLGSAVVEPSPQNA